MSVWVPGEPRLPQPLFYNALGIILTCLQEVFDPPGLLPQVFETEINLTNIEKDMFVPAGALENQEILKKILEHLQERYTVEAIHTENGALMLCVRWEPTNRKYYLDPDFWKRDLTLLAQQGPWGAIIILPEGVTPIDAEGYLRKLSSTIRFRFRKAESVFPFITRIYIPSLTG